MSSCYSGDNIAGDHIHTGIAIFNILEPDQKYRLGTVINTSLGATYFTGSKSSPFASLNGNNISLEVERGGGAGRLYTW